MEWSDIINQYYQIDTILIYTNRWVELFFTGSSGSPIWNQMLTTELAIGINPLKTPSPSLKIPTTIENYTWLAVLTLQLFWLIELSSWFKVWIPPVSMFKQVKNGLSILNRSKLTHRVLLLKLVRCSLKTILSLKTISEDTSPGSKSTSGCTNSECGQVISLMI